MSEPTTPPEALLSAALSLLGPRRRGVEELRNRLRKKGFKSQEVANCLAWLEKRDLLDDHAFAQALARDRVKLSPRSPAAVRRELALRGISEPVAQAAVTRVLEEEDISEGQLAEAAARGWVRRQGPKVLEAMGAEDFTLHRERARRRLYGFLSRRGFRGDAARKGMEAGFLEARNRLSPND